MDAFKKGTKPQIAAAVGFDRVAGATGDTKLLNTLRMGPLQRLIQLNVRFLKPF